MFCFLVVGTKVRFSPGSFLGNHSAVKLTLPNILDFINWIGKKKQEISWPQLLLAVLSDLRVWFWVSSKAFQMFPVLFEPVRAALIACKNTPSSEAICLYSPYVPLCKLDTHRNVLCNKNAVGIMFLHADSQHCIKLRGSSDVWSPLQFEK